MKLLILISTLIATSFAFAKDGNRGWLVTPYVGYNSGTTTSTTTPTYGSAAGASTFTEIPIGAFLGYSFGALWLAADVQYGASGTTVTTKPANTPNSTSTRTGIGADVGVKFGRSNIYLTYFSNSMSSPAQNGNQSSTGAGTAIGLNYLFEVRNHFSIGANYFSVTPTSVTQNGTTTQWSTLFSSYSSSSIGILLAFPLMD